MKEAKVASINGGAPPVAFGMCPSCVLGDVTVAISADMLPGVATCGSCGFEFDAIEEMKK